MAARHWHDRLAGKLGLTALLMVLAQVALADDSVPGAVVGAWVLAWLGVLVWARRASLHLPRVRWAVLAGLALGLVLVDDPSLLAFAMALVALTMAALLPRHRFDDALGWAIRLGRHGLSAPFAPLADRVRVATVRRLRGRPTGGLRLAVTTLALPIIGGAVFLALFAQANPLIEAAIGRLTVPMPVVVAWRVALAVIVGIAVWASLRPRAWVTAAHHPLPALPWPTLPVATLTLSLLTFNAIFAVQNALDIAFLWSGAPLPGDLTMAEYAHRGAYALIVTALLAGLFVLLLLRPGAPAGLRWLVVGWIAQNVLLVASSMLRTLNYVDAYGMTVLRLAALAWMALVAVGLALIGWRLVGGRSAAWLINANALAATVVLGTVGVVDLGATAAAWNVRTTLAKGHAAPRLDLCYLSELGTSGLVSLATLERHVREPGLGDRVAALRWQAQRDLHARQGDWRSWTARGSRRLATVEAMVGAQAPRLRPAPLGRSCSGQVIVPAPLTRAPGP